MMAIYSVKAKLLDHIENLTPEEQQILLEFAQNLQQKPLEGMPGEALIALAQELDFDSEDLALMEAAIQEGCEKIDWNEWE